jgi:hypothetical protein
VTNPLSTNFLFRNRYPASVANNPCVSDALVLAAGTFKILYRTKNALAEQAIALGLVRTVVNGFRLQNLTAGTPQEKLWRRQTDGNGVK